MAMEKMGNGMMRKMEEHDTEKFCKDQNRKAHHDNDSDGGPMMGGGMSGKGMKEMHPE